MNTTAKLKQNLLKEIGLNSFDYNNREATYEFDISLGEVEAEYPYANVTVRPLYKKCDRDEVFKIDCVEITDCEVFDENGAHEEIDQVDLEIFISSQLCEF